MLHGKILRSPHAHTRIRSIDASEAEAYPGVYAVVTAKDMATVADKIEEMGEDSINLRYLASNILAHEKVRYHGHAVAAVAAVNARGRRGLEADQGRLRAPARRARRQ